MNINNVLIPITFMAALSAGSVSAIPLLSVDPHTDELVRIESSTGAVTVIGSLNMDARVDVDLARTSDGRLWGLNAGNYLVDLWEINEVTGAVISSTQVTLGGTGIDVAEGLGNIGNQLWIGYSPGGTANSNGLAKLSTSGAVTDTNAANIDIDGLGEGSGTVDLYAVDRVPGSWTRTYTLTTGGTATTLGDLSEALFMNDLFLSGGDLFAIANDSKLYRTDAGSGALQETVSLDRDGLYFGLVGATAVPEPTTLALLSLGIAGIGYSNRRRKLNS